MDNIFLDWKFWTFILGCLNFIGLILIACFNYFANLKLTTNDLKHISNDIAEIKCEQKVIKSELVTINKDISYLRGKIDL